MIRLFLTFLLILTISTGNAKENQLTITKEKVELIITERTSETQLKKFKKALKEEANIDFDYKDIILDFKNQIRKITITVDSNDGVKGTGSLLISNIYNVGFVRNYEIINDSSGEESLIIGNISEKEIKLD